MSIQALHPLSFLMWGSMIVTSFLLDACVLRRGPAQQERLLCGNASRAVKSLSGCAKCDGCQVKYFLPMIPKRGAEAILLTLPGLPWAGFVSPHQMLSKHCPYVQYQARGRRKGCRAGRISYRTGCRQLPNRLCKRRFSSPVDSN